VSDLKVVSWNGFCILAFMIVGVFVMFILSNNFFVGNDVNSDLNMNQVGVGMDSPSDWNVIGDVNYYSEPVFKIVQGGHMDFTNLCSSDEVRFKGNICISKGFLRELKSVLQEIDLNE